MVLEVLRESTETERRNARETDGERRNLRGERRSGGWRISKSQIRELKELLEQEKKGGSTTVNTDRKREWLRRAEEGRERDREREEERKGQKMHCSTR